MSGSKPLAIMPRGAGVERTIAPGGLGQSSPSFLRVASGAATEKSSSSLGLVRSLSSQATLFAGHNEK